MPFAIYESKNEEKFSLVNGNASLLGETGLIKICAKSGSKKKSIFEIMPAMSQLYEVKAHFDKQFIQDTMIKNYEGIKAIPCFLIQSSESNDSDVFLVTDIFLYSSCRIKDNDDGWITFMLGLDRIGYTDKVSIREKSPIIKKRSEWLRCYTINYFVNSSIGEDNKLHGKWAPSGPYKSNFIWKNMGEYIKENMIY